MGRWGGAWVAQSVKHLTLGFGLGHDLAVRGVNPRAGLGAYLGDSLSLPLPFLRFFSK